MQVAVIFFGIVWPFIVAIVLGAVDVGEPLSGLSVRSTLGCAPAIFFGVFRAMPNVWPAQVRATISAGLAFPLVVIELFVAYQVMVSTYVACGGSVDI